MAIRITSDYRRRGGEINGIKLQHDADRDLEYHALKRKGAICSYMRMMAANIAVPK